MVERGLVKKVSFSSLERSLVKKYFSEWLDKKDITKVVK
jgi:16S rRNA C1402 N4-methylase RsmH